MRTLHLELHGRVQGVGFRAFVARCAREHGVIGEVSNRADGGVDVIAQGDPGTLEAFAEVVRRGPAHARVERYDTRTEEGPARYRGFHISG
jgi:acylphosphatase